MTVEHYVANEARRIRAKLVAGDVCSDFRLHIDVSGRVYDGEIKVEYKLFRGYYGDASTVTGNSVEAVLDEFIRRCGWNDRHAPLALPDFSDQEEEVADV